MKNTLFKFFHALPCGALLFTGCVHNTVTRQQLPPDWIAALPPVSTTIPDVSGTYESLGQITPGEYSKNKNKLLKAVLLPELFAKLNQVDKDIPSGVQEVQLQQSGATQLKLTAWRDSQVLQTLTLDIKIDRTTGAVLLPPISESGLSGNEAAAMLGSDRVHLYKGTDGCLYVQKTTHSNGVMFLVPIGFSAQEWGRWVPAPDPAQKK